MKIIPFNRPEANSVNNLSGKYEREVYVEWFLQNADLYP